MTKIKTSKLIEQENIALSITVSPANNGNGYIIRYILKEEKKDGSVKVKTVKVDEVIEDADLPQISNQNVKHLGYNIYKHLVKPTGFYINLYRK